LIFWAGQKVTLSRRKGGFARKKCNPTARLDGGWCIIVRAWEHKMEIPDISQSRYIECLAAVRFSALADGSGLTRAFECHPKLSRTSGPGLKGVARATARATCRFSPAIRWITAGVTLPRTCGRMRKSRRAAKQVVEPPSRRAVLLAQLRKLPRIPEWRLRISPEKKCQ
jgi:hypothetical protein